MMISTAVQQIYQGGTTMRRKSEAEKRPVYGAPGDAIPPRYRDGRGGIALEQVEQDRREARRQLVRAMIRRLGGLWS